jgi:transcriptional regulator with XRE-family HTH domain
MQEFNRDSFAANLRAARAFCSISQDELAQMTGISRDAIYTYENGITTPGADKVHALCVALKTTPNKLLGWQS